MKRKRLPRIGRARVTDEVTSEIESHLALQAADLVAAGWSPEDASREAVRRFGNRTGIEREMLTIDRKREGQMRRTEYIADIGQDLKLALRYLRKRPWFAVVAILVIALGVGANAAVFAVVDGALLKPLPFMDDGALVYMHDRQGRESGLNPSYPEFRDWEREADFLSGITAIFGNGVGLRTDAGSEMLIAGNLSGDPAKTFGVQPVIGRWFTPEEMRNGARVALLDEGFWRERYGAQPDALGKQLRLTDELYTIIGVLPHEVILIRKGNDVSLWLPFKEDSTLGRGFHFLYVVGRLGPGVTMEQGKARADLLTQRLQAAEVTDHGIELTPLRSVLVGDARRTLVILLSAALILLLIVCANLANLYLSKSLERDREFAVRAALGAGRSRLVRQVLTESIAIGIAGGLGGLLLARSMIGVIRGVAERSGALPPTSAADPRVLAFTLAVSVLVGTLFGLWPALRAGRFDLSRAIREAEGGRSFGSRGLWRRRRALVAAELALSVVLLSGAGLLVRSLALVLTQDAGFSANNVLIVGLQLPQAKYRDTTSVAAFSDQVLQRLRSLPGVIAVGAGSHLPLDGSDTRGDFDIVGRDYAEDARPTTKKRVVSPGFFEALGTPVIRGRAFNEADRRDGKGVVIINQALARRYWPGEDPLGKSVRFLWGPGDEQEIVGVVADIRQDALDQPAEGTMYRPLAQYPRRGYQVVLRTDNEPLTLAGVVRSEIARLDPAVLVSGLDTMEQRVRQSLSPRRTIMLLIVGLAIVALTLTAVGVYAVTAQAVTQRTREIGVRMAIGASSRDILRHVLSDEAVVIGLGVLFGLAGAWAATRVLANLIYGVGVRDALSLGSAATVLTMTALLATWLPAVRAARTDPMIALRGE